MPKTVLIYSITINKQQKFTKLHLVEFNKHYHFVVKMIGSLEQQENPLIGRKKMPNYNIYVSIILMIYYLLFSVGGTLILYTCTYFYHYCA